jgi:hypothetical protein
MAARAWHDADALIRATARVERRDGERWSMRGTAFFVGERTLLTCAHVVWPGDELQVATYGRDGRRDLPVTVTTRAPDLAAADPYPFPDVAVLTVAPGTPMDPHPVAWLDDSEPGEDLWAYGYTDEYRQGDALGHGARFRKAGQVQVSQADARMGWRMQGDRVRPGMSGAPVLDLLTGRVVGIVKRTADATQALGAYFTPLAVALPAVAAEVAANRELNASPARDDEFARQLWGELVAVAAAPLAANAVVRATLATAIKLSHGQLVGDDADQARRLARELFLLDLDELVPVMNQFAQLVRDAGAAASVFEAVAACTSYMGEPWLAVDAAAELAAQVETVATGAGQAGRVLHLRCDPPEFRRPYLRRGNRGNTWAGELQCTVYGHEVEPATGLPVELEWELRGAVLGRFPSYARRAPELGERVLDDGARAQWDKIRPGLAGILRKQRVVVLLPPQITLDHALVESLVREYPLVFLAASAEDPSGPVLDGPAFRALDPDVEDTHALLAYLEYEAELVALSQTTSTEVRT